MKKLNLGCGEHPMQGWINYDIDAKHPMVKKLDLSKERLPHENQTVDFIYSEHFLEHLTKPQATALLQNCYWVLKKSGVMRISTPDLRRLCQIYVDGVKPLFWEGVWEPQTACDMVNEGMRLWGHQYLWDYEELSRVCHDVAFRYIFLRSWRQSAHLTLQNLEVRPYTIDLIVELHK